MLRSKAMCREKESDILDMQQKRKTVKIGELVLGDGKPKICVPVAAGSREELSMSLERLKDSRNLYDLVEFRADYYPFRNFGETGDLLGRVRDAAGTKPVLFTFRTKEEGGIRSVTCGDYVAMNEKAAESGADLVDLQFDFVKDRGLPDILDRLHEKGSLVVGSFHDFRGTPPAQELVKRMVSMQQAGFDISKVAVMPRDREDVLELLFASVQMEEDWADRPYITMSMGETGKITRICGEFSGSCLTFSSLDRSSAPGQIRAENMRQILKALC